MKRFTLLLWLCSCLVCLNAANVYVSTSGADSQDGSSWATAKFSLQAAVDVALDGDTVFVSEGLYNQAVKVKKSVNIFGGYAATTGERNPEIYHTILDGTNLNSTLLTQVSAFKDTTFFDGLILQNAHHTSAGGAVVLKAKGVLRNSTIRNCYTEGNAGGVSNGGGVVTSCVIELCEAIGTAGAVHNMGGLVENTIIRGCKGNYAAIRNESQGIVRNCLLHNNEPSNSAWPNSGGIYNPSGVVYNNTIVCNYGSQYAGIHSDNIAYNNLLWNNQS